MLFLFPRYATMIVWVFTAAVAITAAQRVVFGVRLLRAPARTGPAGAAAMVPLPLPAKNSHHERKPR